MNSTIFSLQSIFAEFKRSMRLSIPLIASQLVYGLSGFVATVMIAHLGRNELATNILVWGVFATLILLFIGILNAVSVLVAQSHGAKDHNGIQIATRQGFILSFIFTIPMMATMWIAPQFLILTGQNPEIIKLSIPFFHSLGWCILPLNLLIVMEQFLIGVSFTRLVLFISLIDVPLEILSFYVLVFGKCGFPKMGLPGIGYGFFIAITISTIAVGIYLHFSQKCRNYKIFSNWWKINKQYIYEIIRVGFPMGGTFCIEVSFFTTVSFMIGKFGSDVLAAHQIAYQYFIFTLTFIFGLQQGTSVRIGNEVGRNNKEILKLSAYVNMGIGLAFMLLISCIYIIFPAKIIGLDIPIHDSNHQTLVYYATKFLIIAAILQLADCLRLTCAAALRGLKDTKIPMYISAFCYWLVAFPCAYLLAFKLNLGGNGIWIGLVIGTIVAACILIIRFYRLIRHIDLTTLVTHS